MYVVVTYLVETEKHGYSIVYSYSVHLFQGAKPVSVGETKSFMHCKLFETSSPVTSKVKNPYSTHLANVPSFKQTNTVLVLIVRGWKLQRGVLFRQALFHIYCVSFDSAFISKWLPHAATFYSSVSLLLLRSFLRAVSDIHRNAVKTSPRAFISMSEKKCLMKMCMST